MKRGALVAAALAAACTPDKGPLMTPGENCLECHGGTALAGEPPTIPDPDDARRWTIAGTVFSSVNAGVGDGVRGAKVHVLDANGRALTLRTNRAGNFYTAEPVRFPLRVSVEQGGVIRNMEPDVPYGGCNACHRLPPRQDAPGRISVGNDAGVGDEGPLMMPGENCLECHGGTTLAGEPPTIPAPRVGPPWTVAGTVFSIVDAPASGGLEGVSVHLTDADGQTLTLVTNAAGNFYTDAPLRFPLQAAIEHLGVIDQMEDPVPYGGCNSCHRLPPRQEAPGRIAPGAGGEEGLLMMPGENCLECHGVTTLAGEPPTILAPRVAPPWTVAGTVFSLVDAPASGGLEGVSVHLTDADGQALTLVTNAAGNFYTAEPVRFPLRASVESGGVVRNMEPDVPYGGCNACHRLPPRQDAPGRISVGNDAGGDEGPLMMPGENCLECHGGTTLAGEPPTVPAPRVAPPWTVAGTVFSIVDAPASGGLEGASVHLTDADGQALTLVTNAAGNFHTDAPLRFPLQAAIEHLGVIDQMADVPYGGCNSCHRLPPRQEAPGRIAPGAGGDD